MAKGDVSFVLSAVDRTQAAFKSVGASLNGLQAQAIAVRGALGSIGVALGAGFLANKAKGIIDAADDMNKLSQAIGITVEDLSALEYAASLSGVSTEELAVSLRHLNQAVDSNAKAFARLELDPTKFKNTDEALRALAERFARIPDGITKTSLAVELFGRSGAKLVPLLNGGVEGLEAFRKEAEKLGVVLDAKTAGAAERFNDSLTRLGTGFNSVFRGIAKDALPALQTLVNRLNAAQEAYGGLIAATGRATKISDLWRTTAEQLEIAKAELEEYNRLQTENGSLTSRQQSAVEALRKQIDYRERLLKLEREQKAEDVLRSSPQGEDKLDRLAKRGADTFKVKSEAEIKAAEDRAKAAEQAEKQRAEALKRYLDQLQQSIDKTKELSTVEQLMLDLQRGRIQVRTEGEAKALIARAAELDAINAQIAGMKKLDEQTEAEIKARDELAKLNDDAAKKAREATEKAIDQAEEEAEAIEKLVDPYRELAQQLERLDDLYVQGFVSQETYIKRTEQINDEILSMGKTTEKGKEAFDEIKGAVASATEESIVNFNKLSDVVDGFFKDLTRIATRKGIVEPLVNSIFGSGGQGGGGLIDKAFPAILSLFGAANGGVFKGGFQTLAGGGVLTSPTLALMREAGQNEAVVPLPDGRSIPVKQSGASAPVNVYMTVNTPDAGSFRRSQQQILVDVQRQLTTAARRR